MAALVSYAGNEAVAVLLISLGKKNGFRNNCLRMRWVGHSMHLESCIIIDPKLELSQIQILKIHPMRN